MQSVHGLAASLAPIKAGVWIVTGTYRGFSDTASLTVNHAWPIGITILPNNPTFTAGTLVNFTATAADSYGNSWDVTGLTSWSITNNAGGSWTGNVYLCALAGVWTITGNY